MWEHDGDPMAVNSISPSIISISTMMMTMMIFVDGDGTKPTTSTPTNTISGAFSVHCLHFERELVANGLHVCFWSMGWSGSYSCTRTTTVHDVDC